jgi:hypothetical protein
MTTRRDRRLAVPRRARGNTDHDPERFGPLIDDLEERIFGAFDRPGCSPGSGTW